MLNPPKMNRRKGKKPSLHIVARTIPEAWEQALLMVWEQGVDIETDYDVEAAGEPPSREAAVLVEVTEPLGEPRIHKDFPEGLDSLQKYDMEVRNGIHDHWVKIKKDDGGTIWDYSYHERLFAYPTFTKDGPTRINQMEQIYAKLLREEHITKSAQAVTWLPASDHDAGHSPCLQRVLFRLIPDEDGEYVLNMDTTWRSRDLRNAWFENVFAFTSFQRDVAGELSRRMGRAIRIGSYMDFSDSLHIYGRDFNPSKQLSDGRNQYVHFVELVERMKREPLENRTWRSDDPIVAEIMEEERLRLLADPDYTRRGGDEAKPKPVLEGSEFVGVEMPDGTRLDYKDGKLFTRDGKPYEPELLEG